MKKKKILTGAAIGASMAGLLFGGCKAVPQDLYGPPPEALYGPPAETETLTEGPTDEELFPAETLYGPPADENTEADFGEKTEEAQTDATAEAEPSTAMALYGPPPAEG